MKRAIIVVVWIAAWFACGDNLPAPTKPPPLPKCATLVGCKLRCQLVRDDDAGATALQSCICGSTRCEP